MLDSLRFGEPASRRARATCSTARSRGIGHYGNSIGVATVGGEVYFESAYEQNCLVNAMCLGLIETEQADPLAPPPASATSSCCSARAPAATGSAARRCSPPPSSASEDAAKRPTVQIGDPFEEAKLLECSLELLDRGLLVALQDLGAAGLTSSSAEMAAKGEVGLDLDVAKVPLREADMEPFEIMVSESQERMLCVVEPERRRRRCSPCARSGRSTRPRSASSPTRGGCACSDGDAVVGDMPVPALVDECPLYDLAPAPPATPLYAAPPRVLDGRRRTRARRCSRCSARPTSPRAGRCSSSTTASSARAPCAARSRPTPPC